MIYIGKIGISAAIAVIASAGFAAPAHAEKTPKPGTVIKGLKSCKDAPPSCYVIARTMPGEGGDNAPAPAPASAARQGMPAVDPAPSGRMAYGCLNRDGTITVTSGGCPKGTLLVKIILRD